MTRTWTITLLLIVPLLVLPWSGCGGGGNGDPAPTPPDNGDPAAPEITAASVEPTEVRFSGGVVTISATVQSEAAIDKVEAAVAGPDESQTVALQADGAGYAGTFTAPANGGGDAVVYEVTVTATDDANQTSAAFNAGQFSVQTVDVLPQPDGPPADW